MTQSKRHIAFCPHCGNHSPQSVAFEHVYRDTWYGEDGKAEPHDEVPDSEAIVCICETCNAVLLYDGISCSESGVWPELMYPKNTTLPTSVPIAVRDIYREAVAVKQNAPNAYAIMIRKGLEAICDDRSAPSGNLANRLSYLVDKGEMPPVLAELTNVLRLVGNTAAHGSSQTITTPMTWAIDDFFRVVIEYVYVAPSKLSEFKKRLAAIKQDANDA
jgi:hypothetical protein